MTRRSRQHPAARPVSARGRLVGQALVLSLVVAGTSAFAALSTSVVLDVDGERSTVTTFGRTVAQVLDAHGVDVGQGDLVSPALDEPVLGAAEVVVRRGRELTVEVDGRELEVWSTALTVAEVVAELGLREEQVRTSVSRSTRVAGAGEVLRVSTPKTVQVAADGATGPVQTTAATVREALREAGVVLGPDDTVSVPLDAAVVDGLLVVVTRVQSVPRSETVTTPFATVRQDDDRLTKGREVVAVRGREGRSVTTYLAQEAGGVEVGRTVLTEIVLSDAVDEVIRVGTREVEAYTGEGVWGALAQCESGGNPSVVSSNGLYHGLYQFRVDTWRSVGGSGLPSQATPEEQTERAKALQARSGWGQWPACARRLGLL